MQRQVMTQTGVVITQTIPNSHGVEGQAGRQAGIGKTRNILGYDYLHVVHVCIMGMKILEHNRLMHVTCTSNKFQTSGMGNIW